MSSTRVIAVSTLAAALVAGCGSGTTAVQCEETPNCNLHPGGVCETNPATGNQWCTYPDATCPSGQRWSDFDTGDGLSGECVVSSVGRDGGVVDGSMPVDAREDAAPADAMPDYVQWDLIYPSKIRVPLNQQDWIAGDGDHMIVNTGTLDLDMASLTPGTSTDTATYSVFSMVVVDPPPTAKVPPGYAFGMLSTAAQGMVTEPILQERQILRFRGELLPADGSPHTIQVTHRIELGNANGAARVIAPQTWEIMDVPSPQIVEWARVSSDVIVVP